MRSRIKRITALLICMTILFGIVPTGTFADEMASTWLLVTDGMELEKAETYEQSHSSTIILYVGETTSVAYQYDDVKSFGNSNPAVADVQIVEAEKIINITAIEAGFCTFSYDSTDDSHGSIVIRVIAPSLSIDAPATATRGTKTQLTATANRKPGDAEIAIEWSSSDTAVATVDSTGLVEFFNPGSVTITASTEITTVDGTKKELSNHAKIEVKNGVQSLTLTKSELPLSELHLFVGDNATTTIVCDPDSYLDQEGKITVRSTNPAVVTVSRNGASLDLTAVGKGSAMVIVSCEDKRALLRVNVDQVSMRVQPENLEIFQGSTYVAVSKINPVAYGDNVTVSVKDPTVASATWVAQGENVCIIKGLSVGATDITLTLTYNEGTEKKTIEQTIHVNVVADEDADKQFYTVSFVDYDGTLLLTRQVKKDQTIQIPTVSTIREGYDFEGFKSDDAQDERLYRSGEEITVTDNLVFEAQYAPTVCTVSYSDTDSDTDFSFLGQTLPPSQQVAYGDLLEEPDYGLLEVKIDDPERSGEKRYYRFDGWKKAGTSTMWDFQQPVTSSVTLVSVWEMVEVEIICRTYKGTYGTPIVVPKGKTNVVVKDLPQFSWGDGEYHSYTYVNQHGVGKKVFFRFWQHGNNQISIPQDASKVDYTIGGPVLHDEIITAVYEPGPWGENRENTTYYHSTNVYVPVDYVVKKTGATIYNEMELTDVYPLYGVKTSPVNGIVYTISDQSEMINRIHDNMIQLDPRGGEYIYRCQESDEGYKLNYNNTAKFGRVDLSYHVGDEFTDKTTGRTYLITGIDQENVETVWMCDMLGHVFNGYCVGGTWNALGQVTLYLEEKAEETCKVKVSYYMLPKGWVSLEQAEFQTEDANVLAVDQLLSHKDFIDGFGGLYPNVAYEWVKGSEGSLTEKNEEYELKLYYADITYGLTVNYWKRKPEGQPDEKAAESYNETGLLSNQSYSVTSPVINGFSVDKPVVQGIITNHDVVVDVYYECPVNLYYKAQHGGTVIRSSETVNEVSGEADGSLAVPNEGFTFVGWYYDEACTKPIAGAASKFVPQKADTVAGGSDASIWHVATFYAKFENRQPITITANSDEKVYDGTPITNSGYTVDGLPDGYTIEEVVVTGTQKNAGNSSNVVTSYVIKDSAGNNVTKQFTNVTKVDGTLTVTPRQLTITSADGEWEYDGKTHTKPKYTVKYGTDEITPDEGTTNVFTLPSGDKLTVTSTAAGVKNVLDSKSDNNTFTYTLDNSANYVVKEEIGDLSITPKEDAITITANSDEKVYDGTPITNSGYTVAGLPDGYTIEAVVESETQKNVGNSPNKVTSYVIKDSDGNNVTEQFANVETVDGTLTVTPRQLTITSADGEWEYDGKTHTKPEYTVKYGTDVIAPDKGTTNVFTLPSGDKLTVTSTAAGVKNVLDSQSDNNTFTYTLSNSANYVVKKEIGDLSITPKEDAITITANSDEKVYDGTPITNSGYTVDGLPDGYTIEAVVVTGTQTDAGSSSNVVTSYVIKDSAGSDVTDQFANVETVDGTLTVKPKPVTVTLTGHTKTETYDGNEKQVTGYDVEISDKTYTKDDFTYTGSSQATGTTVGAYPMELDKTKLTNNNPNYEVTFVTEPGMLTIISVELVVSKTSDKAGKKVAQGEKITYTITVENKSSLVVTNVKVDDEKTNMHEVIPRMLPGEKKLFTTTWIVTEQDVLAGYILNSVTAKADPVINPEDPDKPFIPQDTGSTTDIPVDVIPELVVIKTSDKEGRRVSNGETITYTITVKNKGNVTLHNVKVDDEKTNMHQIIPALVPGGMKEFTTTWCVTDADVQNGKILNSVTAKSDPVKNPKNPDKPFVPQDSDTVEDQTARKPHRVTVNYYRDSIDGERIAPQVVQVHYAGDQYYIVSLEIPGYTASIEIVQGTMDSGDLEYNVIYTPTAYQVTIQYVDMNGNVVVPPYQTNLQEGESYQHNSPAVDGMIPTRPSVEGIMPGHDVVITVLYLDSDSYTVVEEPDMPKGLGSITLNAGDCFE